jgi:hypothetical protein
MTKLTLSTVFITVSVVNALFAVTDLNGSAFCGWTSAIIMAVTQRKHLK